MRSFTQIHTCGHLYGEGGRGERALDLGEFSWPGGIGETRELPGFVMDNVTYESHRFWVHFLKPRPITNPNYTPQARDRRCSGVLVVVHHGGGWEVWRGDSMLAAALERYGDDDKGLFLLCWFMVDAAREAHQRGYGEAKGEYQRAFVDGRLKKRKLPARGAVKVWIEPAPDDSGMVRHISATEIPA